MGFLNPFARCYGRESLGLATGRPLFPFNLTLQSAFLILSNPKMSLGEGFMKHNPGDSIRKINGKRRIAVSLAATVGFLVVAYFAISLVIGSGVRSVSAAALRKQPGDRVAAIMAYADSSTHSVRDRNRAVGPSGNWAIRERCPYWRNTILTNPAIMTGRCANMS